MKWLVKWLVLGSVLLIVSCSSDETMDAYSDKGADVDKAFLEASAQGVEQELKALGQTDFALMCQSMSERLSDVELTANARFVEGIVKLGQLMHDSQLLDSCFSELISLTFDRDYYCNAILSQGYGVWKWDDEEKTFLKSGEHETDVVFIFPATNAIEGPVATLTISDLAVYNGLFPGKGDELDGGEIVESALERLLFSLKVDEELILTGNVLASFTEQGYYKDVAMTFNPRPFNLIAELGKTDIWGYWVLSFNRDSELIMEQDLSLEFDSDNYQMPVRDILNLHRTKDVFVELSARTGVLYNELVKVETIAEGTQANAQALATALNSYADMSVRYATNNRLIAVATAVPKFSNEDELGWFVDLELQFSDGSIESAEAYFDNYITNFKIELEDLVSEFEQKFGI